MTGPFATLTRNIAASRTARRRARNLRRGWTISLGPAWAWAALALVMGGAVALALHARALPNDAQDVPDAQALAALQPLAPGLELVVPTDSGVSLTQRGALALVIASGMQAGPAVRVDLCTQMLDPANGRLLPLRVGYPFGEAAALARGSNGPARSVLLARDGSAMPRIDITGNAGAGLAITWNAGFETASWISDATGGVATHARQGQAALGSAGWLLWRGEALRFTRQPSGACPQAGELVLQHFQHGEQKAAAALVQAFPASGVPVSLRLRPGIWTVPLVAGAGLEDQALFEALRARGLLRLGRDGLIELAPRDLLAWLQADESVRAPLPGWQHFQLDAGACSNACITGPTAPSCANRCACSIANGGWWRGACGPAQRQSGKRQWQAARPCARQACRWRRCACLRSCRKTGRRGIVSAAGRAGGVTAS